MAGPTLLWGSHLSIAGSICNALREARSLGMDSVQVFTKNQQQWKPTPLDPAHVSEWHALRREWGWNAGRVVSHASYLINLASPNDELWEKSIALMRVEIERCELLDIACLVHHPGACTGSTREQGIERIARAYARLSKDLPGFRTVMCLEGTTGSGSHLGGPFEDLRDLRVRIIEKTARPEAVGFCLDTCHLHAAGHDLSTLAAGRATLARFDEVCGIEHVRCWHMNDSKGGLGTKLDRHEHIGLGCVGGYGPGKPVSPPSTPSTPEVLVNTGFAAVIEAMFGRGMPTPMILETPKEDAKAAAKLRPEERLDSQNLARLRGIARTFEGQTPMKSGKRVRGGLVTGSGVQSSPSPTPKAATRRRAARRRSGTQT